MWETSESMRLSLMEGRRLWYSHSSNSTLYYWLYEKGMIHTMVGLQGLHLGDALKHPSISAGIGLKLFCPWCLKLGGNMETITIHLCEVHYQMAIACDICHAFASMAMYKTLWRRPLVRVQREVWQSWKRCPKHTECIMPMKYTERLRILSQDTKKELKSCKLKKVSKCYRDRRDHLSHSGQV